MFLAGVSVLFFLVNSRPISLVVELLRWLAICVRFLDLVRTPDIRLRFLSLVLRMNIYGVTITLPGSAFCISFICSFLWSSRTFNYLPFPSTLSLSSPFGFYFDGSTGFVWRLKVTFWINWDILGWFETLFLELLPTDYFVNCIFSHFYSSQEI